ncbi:OLC1v1036388C1 [Oldenlandia corymbosa var. corymbosa]|uniref:OLC1v1036388C1 n=1 Tax=Oldenlandia corymbosa var. corymbosa TaxID=529605 RepID=A0AAV1CWB8_OLDCO|nr:OLC1v1036388C1 [Oldenlandia corymbosa var. corymbosa]
MKGEVLNNIRVSSEQFRDDRDKKNLLDNELGEHLNEIIDQTHAALTLGPNDEIDIDDTQILVDDEPSLPLQSTPDARPSRSILNLKTLVDLSLNLKTLRVSIPTPTPTASTTWFNTHVSSEGRQEPPDFRYSISDKDPNFTQLQISFIIQIYRIRLNSYSDFYNPMNLDSGKFGLKKKPHNYKPGCIFPTLEMKIMELFHMTNNQCRAGRNEVCVLRCFFLNGALVSRKMLHLSSDVPASAAYEVMMNNKEAGAVAVFDRIPLSYVSANFTFNTDNCVADLYGIRANLLDGGEIRGAGNAWMRRFDIKWTAPKAEGSLADARGDIIIAHDYIIVNSSSVAFQLNTKVLTSYPHEQWLNERDFDTDIPFPLVVEGVELDLRMRGFEFFSLDSSFALDSLRPVHLKATGRIKFQGKLTLAPQLAGIFSITNKGIKLRSLPLDELELASLRGSIQKAEIQLNFQKRRGHGVLSVLRPKFSGALGEALDVAVRWSGDVWSGGYPVADKWLHIATHHIRENKIKSWASEYHYSSDNSLNFDNLLQTSPRSCDMLSFPSLFPSKGILTFENGDVNLVATQVRLKREHLNIAKFEPDNGLDPLLDLALVGSEWQFRIQSPASQWQDKLVVTSTRSVEQDVLSPFEAARVFESQLAESILEGDGQLAFKKLATATLETLMPRIEGKGLVYAPQIPSLLSVDPSVDPLKSLASNISFGIEVGIQLGKRLQASVVRQMKDSEMAMQWTLIYQLTSRLRVLLQSAPSKRLLFEYSTTSQD